MPKGVCSCVGKLIKKFDMFAANPSLRYKGSGKYTTVAGGITSILVLILFAVLFFSEGLKTVNKDIIFSAEKTTYQLDPSEMKLTTNPKTGLMFGIWLLGYNLNDPNFTYFDIQLVQSYYSPLFQQINSTNIPLEQCTEEHFNTGDSSITDLFNKFGGPLWLCPPLNYELTLVGRISSDILGDFSVHVNKCDNATIPNCQSETLLAANSTYTIAMPTLNSIINAGHKDYRTLYVQDNNYLTFSSSIAANAIASVQEVAIQTDESLTPMEDIRTEVFPVIPDPFDQTSVAVTGSNNLVQVNFRKSSASVSYTRSFNKLDTYLSYVGGLVSTVLGLIFIMNNYADSCFEVSLASRLFTDEGKKIGGLDFRYFFAMFIKKITSCCCSGIEWPKTTLYNNCIEEIDRQLDIQFLLQKIAFLEKALSLLFKEHQLEMVYLLDKQTLKQAEEGRIKYSYKKRIDYEMHEMGQQQMTKDPIIEDSIGPPIIKKQQHIAISNEQLHLGQNESSLQSSFEQVSELGERKVQLKHDLLRVVEEGKRGDQISHKIVEQINPTTLPVLGIDNRVVAEEFGGTSTRMRRRKQKHQVEDKPKKKVNEFQDLVIDR